TILDTFEAASSAATPASRAEHPEFPALDDDAVSFAAAELTDASPELAALDRATIEASRELIAESQELIAGSRELTAGSRELMAESRELTGEARDPSAAGAVRSHGEVHVVSRVVGFKKIKFYTNENVGSGELDLPEQQMHTSSYWLTIPAALMASLPFAGDDRRDGVVGLAFAMKNIAQLLLMCDGHDIALSVDGGTLERSARTGGIGGVPDALATDPNVFIYDNYPGGIGFSRPLFEMHGLLLARTRELIAGCPCESGCPSCVGPEGNTGPHAKQVASRILDRLLEMEAA
ncbi:MAG: DUF1998 domain-containing protein, partial [Acidobacteriota bacterium]